MEEDRFNELRGIVDRQQQQIDELRGVRQPTLDITPGTSQRQSSVADDARVIDGGPGYPVDGIKEQTPCELHDVMKNISVKVAVGFAFVPSAKATWHGGEIPAGYARVGVDQIIPEFQSMELDIPGPEGQPTLGECLGEVILWNKKNIKFPGSAPIMPPPPPSRRRSPSPPPRSPSPPPRSHTMITTTTARVRLDLQ